LKCQHQFFLAEATKKELKLKMELGLNDQNDLLFNDASRLEQVLVNLIKNAIKFTQKGSVVFGYHREKQDIRFFVRDTGMGIDLQQQNQIFERFRQGDLLTTRKYEGAGLGLSISKALVEMMGGSIGVESLEGNGSEFFFTIPTEE